MTNLRTLSRCEYMNNKWEIIFLSLYVQKTDLCHLQTLLDQVPNNLEVTVLVLSPVGLCKEFS